MMEGVCAGMTEGGVVRGDLNGGGGNASLHVACSGSRPARCRARSDTISTVGPGFPPADFMQQCAF
jgi:hypothetical protein